MIRRIGTLLLLVGVGMVAWSATVYLWKDPFTTLYTALEQRRLDRAFERRLASWPPPTAGPSNRSGAGTRRTTLAQLRPSARAYHRATRPGDPVARIRIPRLGLETVVVEGTDAANLRRGPGRHEETFMPGEGELVYVAGHRTTFGAPFSDIDALRPGDTVVLELPYATVEYRVNGHRIVDQHELSVLRTRGREELVLQACHPRFFASQRYLVDARPVRVSVAQDGVTR